MLRYYRRAGIVLILMMVFFFTPKSASADGNKFFVGSYRVDSANVFNAADFRLEIMAGTLPTTSGYHRDFTTAWLSVHDDPDSLQDPNQGFIQVGLITQADGVHWFAFSYEGITCLRGSRYWPDPILFPNAAALGCRGNANDLVSLNTWHKVELVKPAADNFWTARVYDAGGVATDVATVPIHAGQGGRVYRVEANFEQGYNGIEYAMQGQFWMRNLQYINNGWQTWPYSGIAQNQWNYVREQAIKNGAAVTPNHCAEIYGITLYDRWNPWAWFTGTGGAQCGHIFPPIAYDNANGAVAYTGGSWTYNDTCCLKAWKGTLHWDNIRYERANLNNVTIANSITRVYTKAPNRGIVRVKVNNTDYFYSDYAPTKLWQVARSWSVSGPVSIETMNDDCCTNYVDVDAYLIDTPRIGAGTYDDKYFLVRYLGNWTHRGQGVDSHEFDTISFSNEAESAMTFTFTGNSIIYYYTRHSSRGIARITIDGVDKGTIDACSAATQYGVASPTYGGLGAGVHTIQIANTGSSSCIPNPIPNGKTANDYRYIDVDKLVVAN